MKQTLFVILTFLILIIFIITSCSKSNIPNCGCNSPTIQNVDSMIGTLKFDSSSKQYYITLGYISLYAVCDSNFTQLRSIVNGNNQNISYQVLFSGNVTKYCIPDTIIGYNYNMYNIQLTKIKQK